MRIIVLEMTLRRKLREGFSEISSFLTVFLKQKQQFPGHTGAFVLETQFQKETT